MVDSSSSVSGRFTSWMDTNALVTKNTEIHYIKSILKLTNVFICSGLDTFWQSAFAWFFRPLWLIHNHLWTFEPVELPPLSCEWPWHSATYSSKIRFQCNVNIFTQIKLFSSNLNALLIRYHLQEQHAWTSLKGRVVFWYRIRRQGNQIISEVLFKLYGQQCKKCQHNSSTFKEVNSKVYK